MAQSTACNLSLQDPGLDDCQEKTLLPPTDPDAEVMEISGYKLVYVNGACPRNYRVYKVHSMIGLVFQHLTHWSNAVDKIRYAEALDAAVGLDEFLKVALKSTTAPEQPATEEELLDTALPAIMQYSFSPCPLLSKLSDLRMYLIAAGSAVKNLIRSRVRNGNV